ncbi:MAG: oligoendopeptidase F [Candidatus Marinimicrobia bacterium]|mgnify:CR=1 FL=1|nr:oligoendopeptidase F [Candidatus Neomarinimicrobiota bacterium]|tara:strand:+ start:2763 stop:4454 length:1692 start_codon:yes stop_codon:yes gene_type:complete
MKYSELHYERINVEESKKKMSLIVDRFTKADSAQDQINAIIEIDEFGRDYASYAAIASLNFSRNINDENAKAEKEYYDSIGPDMAECFNSFEIELNKSVYKKELSEKWGRKYLKDIEMSLETFDPKIKKMLKEETVLRNDYTKLTAGAKIEFDGEEYNLAGLGPFHSDFDRDTRKRSYEARFNWFSDNATELDDIYDKLVKLRHEIARTLGYENFIELGYKRMGRADYGPDEVANFRKQIVDRVVPVVQKLHEKKKEILGLDHLYVYDGINFKEGDPKPKGTPDELVNAARKMYGELSDETGEFFDMMIREELMDLVNRKGKSPGGFCTSFPKYDRPYIFSNFNGTDHDITVLTHEAGHAFQCYSSRKQPLMGYIWPTMEAAEIHSMSMEFFTWPWMDQFFKEETDRFKYKHIAGSLSFLPYGACVDHFQHWVYENPDVTPKERNQKWLDLESIYLPNRDYDDLQFPKNGGIWQGQLHIYQMPFYYIDYTLAQTCAFQFWIKNQNDSSKAWSDYVRLCKAGGSLTFTELVELAGLDLPFDDGCLDSVVGHVEKWLDGIDPKSL